MTSLPARLSFFVFLLLADRAVAAENEKASDALEKVGDWKKSLVMITVHCPGAPLPDLGTGVLINNKGYVLTAGHVGGNCSGVTTAKMGAVKSPYSGPGEELTATLVARRVNGSDIPVGGDPWGGVTEDIALWKITNLTGSGLVPAPIGKDYPVPGENVRVVGFAGLPFQYPHNPHNNLPGLTIFKTSLSSVAARPGDIPYRLHYTGATLPGVSGGPVFDERDQLIGIHSGRITAVISGLVTTSCTVDKFNNCAILRFKGHNGANVDQPIGVDFMSLKSALDNYSWATSVVAVPPQWLAMQ